MLLDDLFQHCFCLFLINKNWTAGEHLNTFKSTPTKRNMENKHIFQLMSTK